MIVEDEQRIRELTARGLARTGHDVVGASTALAGLELIVQGRPDLVILDLGLPDLDGLELLKMIRAVSEVPVIVTTARDDDPAIVSTLDAGADDYVVKPFSVEQLDARVRAVLRRLTTTDGDDEVRVGALRIGRSARVARLGDRDLDLAPKEFDMLLYLAERCEQVVSKRELLAEVWREPYGGGEKTVDVHLSWLRRKLGESGAEPRYLRTVHGVGVKLVDPAP